MESKKKYNKARFWAFRILALIVACACPIAAVALKFPIWVEEHGTAHTVSVGVILIIFTVLIVFKNAVFAFIKDHLNIKHAPGLMGWGIILIVAYIFVFIGEFMYDLTYVCWMGLIGAAVGTLLTYMSGKYDGGEDE